MSSTVVLPARRYVLKYRGYYLNSKTQFGGVPVWGLERNSAEFFASVDEANAFRESLKPKGEIQNSMLNDAVVVDWATLT